MQNLFHLADRTATPRLDECTDQAAFMADSQVPWGVDALSDPITEPAWRGKPSWYLVTTEDRMIPPQAQRAMSERAGSTVIESAASHSVYVSNPAPVATLRSRLALQRGLTLRGVPCES